MYSNQSLQYAYLNAMGDMPRSSHYSQTVENVNTSMHKPNRDNFDQKSRTCFNCGIFGLLPVIVENRDSNKL
jgi:hypothetical protein